MRRLFHRAVSALTAAAAGLLVGLAGTDPAAAAPETPGETTGDDRPVPVGFRAQSVDWSSPRHGWVLGTAQCPAGECTAVVTSRDGGRTWSAVGAPAAPLAPPGESGVTRIRFADAAHGWAYGPSFYATTDGGRSWRAARLPGDGRQVIALAAGAGGVYVAVSPCRVGTPPYECTQPTTVWRADVHHRHWHRVPVTLPVTYDVVLKLHRRTAYVAVPGTAGQPDIFHATTDGRHWSPRPSPCDKGHAEALVDIAAMSRHRVALLCVGDAGFSRATKHVFTSADTAKTTADAGTTPRLGIQSALAATPSGTLAVASASSGSWLYLSTGDSTWSTVLAEDDGGAGWNDLTFPTDTTGFVVHAPASVPNGVGTLLVTRDAGRHWAPVTIGR